jgi:ATP/ADP translocase
VLIERTKLQIFDIVLATFLLFFILIAPIVFGL